MKSAEGLREVLLYCDGACRGNPGAGGYAAILVCDGDEKEVSGACAKTTNNRMELRAAIAGLESLQQPCVVRMVTDSEYLKRGITEWIHDWQRRGWRRAGGKPVLNRDLWERLVEVSKPHQLEWHWVRGHSGDLFNERCDRLANEAIDTFLAEGG